MDEAYRQRRIEDLITERIYVDNQQLIKYRINAHNPVESERVLLLISNATINNNTKSTWIDAAISYLYDIHANDDFCYRINTNDDTSTLACYELNGINRLYRLQIVNVPTQMISIDEIRQQIIEPIDMIAIIIDQTFERINDIVEKFMPTNLPICILFAMKSDCRLSSIQENLKTIYDQYEQYRFVIADQQLCTIGNRQWQLNNDEFDRFFDSLDIIRNRTPPLLPIDNQLNAQIHDAIDRVRTCASMMRRVYCDRHKFPDNKGSRSSSISSVANKNRIRFEYFSSIKRQSSDTQKQHANTTCVKCNFVCHTNCQIDATHEKYSCIAMIKVIPPSDHQLRPGAGHDGVNSVCYTPSEVQRDAQHRFATCSQCPGACSWRHHVNTSESLDTLRWHRSMSIDNFLKQSNIDAQSTPNTVREALLHLANQTIDAYMKLAILIDRLAPVDDNDSIAQVLRSRITSERQNVDDNARQRIRILDRLLQCTTSVDQRQRFLPNVRACVGAYLQHKYPFLFDR